MADSEWQDNGRDLLLRHRNISGAAFFYVPFYGIQPEKRAAAVLSDTASGPLFLGACERDCQGKYLRIADHSLTGAAAGAGVCVLYYQAKERHGEAFAGEFHYPDSGNHYHIRRE